MSGHSKWATIKRQKGVADLKRGLAFTKLSNAITIAVKRGGGITDINNNFRLRLAVEEARTANMPKDNIERAIRKALGKDAGNVEEVIYEGFAPEGISVIIEAATDNTLRTTSEIKSIFNKEGGSFGKIGSVSYLFLQKGMINVDKKGKSIDELFEIAAESGAEDIEESGDEAIVTTSFGNLSDVREKLSKKGIVIKKAGVVRKPLTPIVLTDKEKIAHVQNFLDKIEALDDVQKVYSNLSSN
ncbi:MAG: YebC/PmpR family DNA-binding transcriptional regulator [Candidatus Levybacteria bacterium]|nr:YebC/PmpR family DNA-binding transcriptional regulator [Candidatus Levybacteria bacterium]